MPFQRLNKPFFVHSFNISHTDKNAKANKHGLLMTKHFFSLLLAVNITLRKELLWRFPNIYKCFTSFCTVASLLSSLQLHVLWCIYDVHRILWNLIFFCFIAQIFVDYSFLIFHTHPFFAKYFMCNEYFLMGNQDFLLCLVGKQNFFTIILAAESFNFSTGGYFPLANVVNLFISGSVARTVHFLTLV